MKCDICGKKEKGLTLTYGEQHVCSACLEENFSVCEDCGTHILTSEMIKVITGDGYMYICPDCEADDKYLLCDHCGNLVIDTAIQSDDNTCVCDVCYSRYYRRCDDCGNIVLYDTTYTFEGIGTICEDCRDNYYICENCGTAMYDSDVHWHNDEAYCEDCIGDIADELIKGYDYKPRPVFYGKEKEIKFGIELEVGGASSREDVHDFIRDTSKKELYYKYDGSIMDYGCEIVSHPCSLDYHIHKMEWDKIVKSATNYGLKSHDLQSHGLHVHIGKQYLKEIDIIKIDAFINECKQFWIDIAGRNNRNYAPFHKRDKIYKYRARADGRCAVNRRPLRTVELRLFRGTLKYETLIARLESVHCLIKTVQNVSIAKLLNPAYILKKFVETAKDYQHLPEYIEKKGWLIAENVEDKSNDCPTF